MSTVGTIIYVKRDTLSMEVENERIDFIMTNMLEDLYTEVSYYLIEVEKQVMNKNHHIREKRITRERRIRKLEKTRGFKRRNKIE